MSVEREERGRGGLLKWSALLWVSSYTYAFPIEPSSTVPLIYSHHMCVIISSLNCDCISQTGEPATSSVETESPQLFPLAMYPLHWG